MARITIEDCLKAGYNKFAIVHLATKRIIQLRRGKTLLVPTDNREIVASLREIAAGKVRMKELGNLLVDDSLTQESTGDSLIADYSAPDDSAGDNSVENDMDKEPETLDEGASISADQDGDLLNKA